MAKIRKQQARACFGASAVVSYCCHVSYWCIARGRRGSDAENPVALAVRERLGCAVVVGAERCELDGVSVPLPVAVVQWLTAWRAGLPMEPLAFFLPVAAQTLQRICTNNAAFATVVELGAAGLAAVFVRPDCLASNWWRYIHAVC